MHGGSCIQISQQPGFKCRCEGTGYFGLRCNRGNTSYYIYLQIHTISVLITFELTTNNRLTDLYHYFRHILTIEERNINKQFLY